MVSDPDELKAHNHLCECENEKHYGIKDGCTKWASHTLRTDYGTFFVCEDCKECMPLKSEKDCAGTSY